jgi:hypothetical protein
MVSKAPVFFVDENDLALGRALDAARSDVVMPGHPKLPEVPRGTLDPDWLPLIGRSGLIVITRDKRMRRRAGEKLAWCQHGVRGFVLTGAGSQSTWESIRVIARWWDEIQAVIGSRGPGPWMYRVTISSKPAELDLNCT